MLASSAYFETRRSMIKKLNHSNIKIALQIFTIFQSSYKIEAELIGTLNFPPLMRSAKDIENSDTLFYGFCENDCLAAIIEVDIDNKHLEINSLTVDPSYFRRGIANKLIKYILEIFDFSKVSVETAVVNAPAINLYKSHGFVEYKRWTPFHGIEKIAMSIE